MKELSGQIKKRSRGPKPKKNFLSVIGPKTNPDPKVRKKIPKFRYSGTPYQGLSKLAQVVKISIFRIK